MNRILFIVAYILITVLFCQNAIAIHDEEEDKLFNPVEVKNGTTLSITDCVALAFKNSPIIKRQKYNLDIAKSNVGIAKSQYFPVINAGIGFNNENNSDNIYHNSHLRELPAVGVSINQLIYNFGKTTSYIKMEKFYQIGAEYEFMDSLCSTLFNVKDRYYRVLKTKALLDLAQNNVEINKHIVDISTKEVDKATAQIYLDEANLSLYEAEKTYNDAVLDLTNAMYLGSNPNYILENTETFSISNDFDYTKSELKIKDYIPLEYNFPTENAINIAYENSPDLQVLISTKEAMEESLKYIKKAYFPDLTGTVGYGYIKDLNTSNNSLAVAVGLNSSVNIKELRHSIQGAQAQLNIAENEINLFKLDLYYEVKRAFNNVDKCITQIPIAKKQTEEAYSTLKKVEKRYKSEIEGYGDIQRARTNYINARKAYITSIADYNLALIQLEMAMHIHIFDIHHKSKHAMHHHSQELLEHLNKALGCDENESKEHTHKKHDKNNVKNREVESL
ncbi:TolC family protein [bacterium]|nr:TolC family protein [bacterium]